MRHSLSSGSVSPISVSPSSPPVYPCLTLYIIYDKIIICCFSVSFRVGIHAEISHDYVFCSLVAAAAAAAAPLSLARLPAL